MAEDRVTFKNDKGEQMVGILHDTGSEVAIPYCWPWSLFCSGDNLADVPQSLSQYQKYASSTVHAVYSIGFAHLM